VSEGHLYSVANGRVQLSARVGEAPAKLDAWAISLLREDLQGAMASAQEGVTLTDHNEGRFEERAFRLLPLYLSGSQRERLAGGLVLPAEEAFRVPTRLLHALASRLDPNEVSTVG
jgi:hypothetical protein